jgi:hypothetical protein
MIRLHRQSILLVLTVLLYLPSYASAVGPPTVLNFDDINTTSGVVSMPSGYGGLSWPDSTGGWGFLGNGLYSPLSPPNRVLFSRNHESGIAESVVTFIGGPKVFDGAFFSGFHDVQFNLYSGATLVATSSVLSFGEVNGGPTFLGSGYAGPVDKVGIIGDRSYFVMDNFTFEQVPEPSILLLLGISAISLLGYRKAKSHV